MTTFITYPFLIAAVCVAATAQIAPEIGGGAPSPGGVDCFTYLLNLSDCLSYVDPGSNLTRPDPGCCPELSNLVNTQPVCLCQLLGNPGQVGVSVDVNRALKLPSACNVTTPPVSLCSAIGIPVSALSPSGSPSSSPIMPPSSIGGGASSASDGTSVSPTNLAASKHHCLTGSALAALFFFTFLF